MCSRIFRAFVVFGLISGCGLAAIPAASADATDRYIVVYKDSANVDVSAKTITFEQDEGFTRELEYTNVFRGFAATLSNSALDRIKSDPDVDFVSKDGEVSAVPSEPPIVEGGSSPTGVRRIGSATATSAKSPSDVAVAVIDTGVDLDRPELNVKSGKNCVGNGPAQDDAGHGTHVSGTIAGNNNGTGPVGVAPGTQLYAVKVLDAKGRGSWSQMICGIDWVTANSKTLNIKVANMSLGGTGQSDDNCGRTNNDALHAAICNSVKAGITYVVAAGNANQDLATFTPASYPEVLTVTAMSDTDGQSGGKGPKSCTKDADDVPAPFSNFAVQDRDRNHTIAAPGVCILSDWLGGKGKTELGSGTSMASPHVAGAAALCLGSGGKQGPCAGMAPAQVVQKLRADAAAQPKGYGFTGDANSTVPSKYYGNLVYAGGY